MSGTASVSRWSPTTRELDHLEMILLGAYPGIDGFPGKEYSHRIVEVGLLPDGRAWPVVPTLSVPAPVAEAAALGGRLLLLEEEGVPFAELTVAESWPLSDTDVALAGPVTAVGRPARGRTPPCASRRRRPRRHWRPWASPSTAPSPRPRSRASERARTGSRRTWCSSRSPGPGGAGACTRRRWCAPASPWARDSTPPSSRSRCRARARRRPTRNSCGTSSPPTAPPTSRLRPPSPRSTHGATSPRPTPRIRGWRARCAGPLGPSVPG